jgi:hypothetical protein
MAVAGFAEGLEPSLQALGAYMVGASFNANFFAFVSVLDLVGEILGGPVMASAYRVRDTSGAPAGYAFLLSAVSPRSLLIPVILTVVGVIRNILHRQLVHTAPHSA